VSIDQLRILARHYPPAGRDELLRLARDHERRREQEILDVAAIAADVSSDSIINLGMEPPANPALIEAFRLQYPNVPPESLLNASAERLEGLARGGKGKYFEVLARDRLNAGDWLGELGLAPGQEAVLASDPTQAGWDLLIRNADGSAAERLQLKATESMAYIKSALEKYPDIRIATTSEIDGAADEILRTDIADEALEEEAKEQLAELAEGPLGDLASQVMEFAVDALPIVPALVVLVTEGSAVLTGRAAMREALQRGAERLGTAAIFSSLGAAMNALDCGVVTVPTTVTLRIAWSRLKNRLVMAAFLRPRTEALLLIAPEQSTAA